MIIVLAVSDGGFVPSPPVFSSSTQTVPGKTVAKRGGIAVVIVTAILYIIFR